MPQASLSSRERLERIFKGEPVDRPALKLWGLSKGQGMLHPDYMPVYEKAIKLSDRFEGEGAPFHIWLGDSGIPVSSETIPTAQPEWVEIVTTVKLKDRELRCVDIRSTVGKPGYTKEHFVKTPEDLKSILAIDYKPYEISLDNYYKKRAETGEDGITLFNGVHAPYAISELTGSELFAFWTYEQRELIHETINLFSKRVYDFTEKAINLGLGKQSGGFFTGWVGPELLIPPLVSFKDFDDFIFSYDKKVCDLIKNAGGYIWVHCHGKVSRIIDRFADMGVDVLNPIEPPDMGDITLAQAYEKIGERMALEGNIEIGDLMTEPEDVIRAQLERAVSEGSRSRRFILCASAGYMEVVNPPARYIDNLLTYLDYGYELVNANKY